MRAYSDSVSKLRILSCIVVFGLTLTGCSSTGPEPAAPVDAPPPLVPAMALPDNAVDNAVARLDGLAEELMEASGIPGMAVAVVHGAKTVYAKGFGVRDVRGDDPVDADTVFQLASVSKSMAATVVAHQVGIGSIDWDTPLVSELEGFALADPAVTAMVTVGDMFAHRSGLPDHAGDKLEDLGFDRRQVLQRLRLLPLAPFRTSYAYTNFGLTAGAEAVAAAAGTDWEQLSADVLYRPLGMTSTSSRYTDFVARPDRAVAHIRIDDGYRPLYERNADAQSPAGGVSSSVNDVARWLAMVLADGSYDGRRIVEPEALLPALTPQSVSERATEPAMRSGMYGYGFNVGQTSAGRVQLSHSGAFEIGVATSFAILPSADVAIVVLTNATPTGVPETLTAEFMDLVQFGEIRQNWRSLYTAALASLSDPEGELVGRQPPADPAAAKALSEYVGVYHNDYWGPATVTEADGALTLALGPDLVVGLQHWDGDVFSFGLINENAPPGTISRATFAGDRLTVEFYDDDGTGVFTR